jgi:predicted metal-dependent enzyme (double-stranded beta helix superfamily)
MMLVDDATMLSQARPVRAPLSQARLGEIASSLAARTDGWREIVRFQAGRRWYRRLALTDDHEVWLLSWLPGQCTGFHDHGSAAGALAVAQGQVRERTLVAGHRPPVRELIIAQGSVRTFGPRYVHDVANVSPEPAVTVHAYSPPLTVMRRFELTSSGLVRTATEKAGQDW